MNKNQISLQVYTARNFKPYEIGFISKSKRKVNLHESLKW